MLQCGFVVAFTWCDKVVSVSYVGLLCQSACPPTVQDAQSVRLSTRTSDRQTDALEMPVIPLAKQSNAPGPPWTNREKTKDR